MPLTPSAGDPPAGPVCEVCQRQDCNKEMRFVDCWPRGYARLSARLVEVERERDAARRSIDEMRSEVLQLVGDVHAVSQDYTNALARALRAEAALDRRGEEERAKALEAAVVACRSVARTRGLLMDQPRDRDAALACAEAIRSLAAAPSGDDTCPEEGCTLQMGHEEPCDTELPDVAPSGDAVAADRGPIPLVGCGWCGRAVPLNRNGRRAQHLVAGDSQKKCVGSNSEVAAKPSVPSGDAKVPLDEAVTIMFDTYAVIGACLDQMRKHRSGPGTEFDESATLLEQQLTEMVQLSHRLGKSIGHPTSGDAKGTRDG